jgi:5-methyltetrahydropteroyltriglutamate--homocysteine methyltransferase
MTAPSPGQIARFLQNQYDADEEAYLYVLADLMKAQNYAIEDAGFVLQLDCPDRARSRHAIFTHVPLEEFRQIIVMPVRRSTMP